MFLNVRVVTRIVELIFFPAVDTCRKVTDLTSDVTEMFAKLVEDHSAVRMRSLIVVSERFASFRRRTTWYPREWKGCLFNIKAMW